MNIDPSWLGVFGEEVSELDEERREEAVSISDFL